MQLAAVVGTTLASNLEGKGFSSLQINVLYMYVLLHVSLQGELERVGYIHVAGYAARRVFWYMFLPVCPTETVTFPWHVAT